ncbi:MAG TPA: adenylate/guanylate cyclase domain-containing protein [Solirubrobacteraceae bacterium]
MTDERVLAGRAALERHAFAEARGLLSDADADGALGAADLDRLGEAAMWAGHVDECLAAFERAYAAHLECRERVAAAATALRIVRESSARGDDALTLGWYRRAARLLEGEPETSAHGYLAQARWFSAMGKHDWDEAVVQAERMVDIGQRSGDLDLVGVGLSRQGCALIARGEVEDGLAALDEATAAAVAGELAPYATFVVYCATVSACRDLADYRRAGQWAAAARRWCERRSLSGFPGICRVYTAEILRLRGEWAAAERDVRAACEELQGSGWNTVAALGFSELGEIRLRVGDLSGAEEAFCTAYELGGDPQPGLARVRLIEGRPADAAAGISRSLEGLADRLARARLLPARVEIALARGEVAVAESASAELDRIAADFDTTALHAAAAATRAAVALTRGELEVALGSAREALARWKEIELPYEAAQARLALAAALAQAGERDQAQLELRAAHATFVKLGARRDARLADDLLGATAGRSPAASSAERAFMFTDVVKSTDLVAAIGDDAWVDARAWHDRALRDLFRAHGGEEITHTGDGFFIAFPDVPSAIGCAIEIQRRLERHRHEHGFALPVRIGLHATNALRTAQDYAGRGVHEAARIAALAQGSEILASQAALARAPAGLRVGEARCVELKGLNESVQIAPIDWRRSESHPPG